MMAFPTTSVLDDFNRTSLGSNWTIQSAGGAGITIVDNQLANSQFSTRGAIWNPDTSLGPDVECYMTLATPTSGGNVGVLFANDEAAGNYYWLLSTASIVEILRIANGSNVTVLEQWSVAPSAGDVLMARYVDGVISSYLAGTLLGTVTDTTYQRAGSIGVRGARTDWRVDDFGGGTLAATVTGAASLTGTGTLTATGTRTVFGAASLTGAGSLLARIPTETPQTLPGGAPAVVKAPRPVHVDDDEDALALILALATRTRRNHVGRR